LPSVVSDAGPLIHLAQAGKLFLLRELFEGVTITSGVKREVVDVGVDLGYEDALIVRRGLEEGWISVKDVAGEAASAVERLASSENVSASDAETLLCARGCGAEAVLVDDRILSELARMYGFSVWSTWIILLEALARGLIELPDVEAAIVELAEHRHKLRGEQAAEILEAARLVASEKKR
jgi:predicted nucleic acid-binding protein